MMLKNAPNYVHNGGWVSRKEATENIETYAIGNKYANEFMVNSAKVDIAILNWLCD
jgi:hypothetical protein